MYDGLGLVLLFLVLGITFGLFFNVFLAPLKIDISAPSASIFSTSVLFTFKFFSKSSNLSTFTFTKGMFFLDDTKSRFKELQVDRNGRYNFSWPVWSDNAIFTAITLLKLFTAIFS